MRDIRIVALQWWQCRLQEYGFLGYYVKLTHEDKRTEFIGPFDTVPKAYEKLLERAEEERRWSG